MTAGPNVIRVKITSTERVIYNQIIDITASAYAEYQAAVSRNAPDKWFADFAERYIDRRNVSDSEGLEDVGLSEFRVHSSKDDTNTI